MDTVTQRPPGSPAAYVEGDPEARLVIVAGAAFVIEAGVIVGLDELEAEARCDRQNN